VEITEVEGRRSRTCPAVPARRVKAIGELLLGEAA
jgi:hypothetical protein